MGSECVSTTVHNIFQTWQQVLASVRHGNKFLG